MSASKDRPDDSLSSLFAQARAGDREAGDRLVTKLYSELRRIASDMMRRERPNHTLQATALVNEAYVRLFEQSNGGWKDKGQFYGIAAHLMRQVLVDHARRRRSLKRGGQWRQITLEDHAFGSESPVIDVLTANELIEQLAALDPRQSQIVEMRIFGGLPLDEIAGVLGFSVRTVKRDWAMARAWLRSRLEES